jgi:hypothetical protein
MRGSCFVARHNQTNTQFLAETLQRFDHHHVGAVCNRMDIFNTFGMQATHQQLSTGNLSHKTLLIDISRIYLFVAQTLPFI